MNRRAALVVLPALALILWTIAPLVVGARTLILRDIFPTHLELRSELGRAVRSGELPLLDGARSGGQALLGNANAVPLYPDNALLLVASDLWQLNAHFWLHWLLALPAMFALGRLWGLGREASWVAAALFALSGYFLSQLNLYNAVAGVALAPALAAVLLACAHPELRRWALPALAGLWALELLGGDPIFAVIALLAAVALALPDRRRLPWGHVALAVAAGTLIAAPQWIATLQVLPGSYRDAWVASAASQGRSSPTALALVEFVLPLFFGRPDLGESWGNAYFGGVPPLYFSLAPGLVALAAFAAGARGGGGRTRVALAAFATSGAFVCFGGLAGGLLARLPGAGLFRFNVKFALVGVLAGCLLAARGLERATVERAVRRRLLAVLGALLALELALAAIVSWGGPLRRGFDELFTRGLAPEALTDMRGRWVAMALAQALIAVVAAMLVVALPRRPRVALVALVALHAASQLPVVRALAPTDASSEYRLPPPLLTAVPERAVVAHGSAAALFGGGYFESGDYPDGRALWRARRAYSDLYSFALAAAGRRTELRPSSEGLDAFPVQATVAAMKRLADTQRLRVLAATGVDHLLLPRALAAEAGAGVEAIATGAGSPAMRLFRLGPTLDEAQLVGSWSYAPHMNAALAAVVATGFDPTREAVIAGDGPPRQGPAGVARVERHAADAIEIAADSTHGGFVVVRRAWLAIWRAEVDGAPAKVRIANLTRLAVEVPPGAHRVRFYVSKRPFAVGVLLSVLGTAALAAVAWRGARAEASRP